MQIQDTLCHNGSSDRVQQSARRNGGRVFSGSSNNHYHIENNFAGRQSPGMLSRHA